MRIAFVSCMFNRVFSDQPVWSWIDACNPDRLVLLGDSLYLDVQTPRHPSEMSDVEFADHLFTLYRELMAQPQFAALVRKMPAGSIDSIWDDHDFLWDDAKGAEMNPVHTSKVRLSTAFHESFRSALARRFNAGSFPADSLQAPFWDPAQPALTTPSLALSPDVWLHLSDGRTHRTRTHLLAESRRTVFGDAQKRAFAARIGAAPQAVHLFASGSTVAGYQRYARDRAWLDGLAAQQRLLVLSGDIHRNDLDAFFTGGFPLHEATSSGAAIRDSVIVGSARQNFGLLDIDAATVTIQLFAKNRLEQRRVLNRQTWLPATV